MSEHDCDQVYDVEAIRKDFPILGEKIYGQPLAYLDNGASSQKPSCVIELMDQTYRGNYANVHRGLHFLSNAATDAYENARTSVQQFIHAHSSDQIVFTKNATEAINLVAYSWAMPRLHAGDEIIVSIMEHHSNLVPWHFLRERQGVKLVFVPVDDDGVLHVEDFERAITPKTKLAAMTQMSNVLGTITPIKAMIDLAHQRNFPILVDGSQAAVHLPVNVEDLGCDWYVFTGHKLYGPSGIGVLYGKSERLEEMQPFLGGGEMIDEVTMNNITYNHPPHRFEAGTPPIVEAIGLGRALQYIETIGRDEILRYEQALTSYALQQLETVQDLRIFGKAKERGGIISFAVAGIHAHDIATYIDRMGVAIRAGTHCAQPLLQRFNMTSTCRASIALYNNKTDIDQLVAALHKARTFFNV